MDLRTIQPEEFPVIQQAFVRLRSHGNRLS
jgi:hypothetical protein